MNREIIKAIENQNVIEFYYESELKVVEPLVMVKLQQEMKV